MTVTIDIEETVWSDLNKCLAEMRKEAWRGPLLPAEVAKLVMVSALARYVENTKESIWHNQ